MQANYEAKHTTVPPANQQRRTWYVALDSMPPPDPHLGPIPASAQSAGPRSFNSHNDSFVRPTPCPPIPPPTTTTARPAKPPR